MSSFGRALFSFPITGSSFSGIDHSHQRKQNCVNSRVGRIGTKIHHNLITSLKHNLPGIGTATEFPRFRNSIRCVNCRKLLMVIVTPGPVCRSFPRSACVSRTHSEQHYGQASSAGRQASSHGRSRGADGSLWRVVSCQNIVPVQEYSHPSPLSRPRRESSNGASPQVRRVFLSFDKERLSSCRYPGNSRLLTR